MESFIIVLVPSPILSSTLSSFSIKRPKQFYKQLPYVRTWLHTVVTKTKHLLYCHGISDTMNISNTIESKEIIKFHTISALWFNVITAVIIIWWRSCNAEEEMASFYLRKLGKAAEQRWHVSWISKTEWTSTGTGRPLFQRKEHTQHLPVPTKTRE